MRKVLCVLLFLYVAVQAIPVSGFSNWQYYRTITVAPTGLSAAVTNFPVCVKLNTPANAGDSLVFAQSQANGYDIRFTASDGVTALPYQRSYWNATTKAAEFWVLVPTVATTTTTLRMYWGNSSAADTSQPSAVFATTNGFRAVFHLNTASGVADTDATTNHFIATPSGSPADTFGGIGGLAKKFGSTSQFYTITNSASSVLNFAAGGPYTLSAWARLTSGTPSGGAYMISKTGNQYAMCFGSQYAQFSLEGIDELTTPASTSERVLADSAIHYVGTWHHYTYVRSGLGTSSIYSDGVLKSSTVATYAGGTRSLTSDVCLGVQNSGAGSLLGSMDEVRLDSGARSVDWIVLNYQTQAPAQTAVLAGANTSNVAAPATPVLTTPANAATNVAVLPTLTWGTVAGAATYRVQVSALSDFSTLAADDSTLAGGTTTLTTALSGNITYYWRANAKNTGGTSAWTSAFSFTTVPAAPAAPTLTIPANAATDVAIAPTLTWGTVTGAATYRVQVSTVTTFSTTVVDDSTLVVGTKAVTGLSNSTTYYWRANAKNAGGTSAWTSAFSFTTIVAAPGAPTLATPANAATGIAVTPTLTWGTVSGAVTYRVQLSTVSTFATTIVDDSTLATGSKAITSALTVNVTYYWRVSAKNAGGTGAWSAVSGFTTVTTGIIAATPHYVPATMGHNGVLEVYMANGSRVMEIAYGASATKTQLLNAASKTLAKGYYTYRFRSIDANVNIVGKLIK